MIDGQVGLGVRCADVSHTYGVDGEQVHALRDIRLSIFAGESVAVLGPSGSGKSTLTSLLAGLRRPTSGRIFVGGDDITGMSESDLLALRSRHIGIVLQNPSRSLLPYGTAEENIRFAQRAVQSYRRAGLIEPRLLLRQLGLEELAGQRAGQLSGGEQQRLSVAVGMAGTPGVLLADEPTSQLDAASRDRVVELLARVGREFGSTVVVVTHDPAVAGATSRTIIMSEGRIVDDGMTAEHFATVRYDGSIPLPSDMLDRLPPGSRVRVVRKPAGVEILAGEEDWT